MSDKYNSKDKALRKAWKRFDQAGWNCHSAAENMFAYGHDWSVEPIGRQVALVDNFTSDLILALQNARMLHDVLSERPAPTVDEQEQSIDFDELYACPAFCSLKPTAQAVLFRMIGEIFPMPMPCQPQCNH